MISKFHELGRTAAASRSSRSLQHFHQDDRCQTHALAFEVKIRHSVRIGDGVEEVDPDRRIDGSPRVRIGGPCASSRDRLPFDLARKRRMRLTARLNQQAKSSTPPRAWLVAPERAMPPSSTRRLCRCWSA